MATADQFNVFAGATDATAPPVTPPDTSQKPAEASKSAPAPKETGKAAKARQGAAQRRTGATQPDATPAVEVPTPEPAPEPETDRPMLTATQEARWEQWLQSAAGKVRSTRAAAAKALTDFHAGVAEAREAGVSEWTVQAAALRGRIDLDELPED